jgi:hypothetical protein
MQPWLKWTLVVVVALAVLYGGLVAFAEVSNGTHDDVTLHLGTDAATGKMYMRCDAAPTTPGEVPTTPGVCSGGDQPTITVHQRDRVTIHLVNDDKGDHTHDFNLQGLPYAFPPVSPEMELHQDVESWTFTAYASGSYHLLCELPNHDGLGMHATFVVE